MSSIILPKTYVNNASGKYPQHEGKYKMSYSQYTSWKNLEYRPNYILQYFSNATLPAGIFAEFGSDAGTYIEYRANGNIYEPKMLGEKDIKVLDALEYPDNCIYEDEIVVDLGDFVIQGFTDRSEFFEDNSVGILDYKTGSIEKKEAFYSSEEYGQSTLYAYQKEKEGKAIAYSKVLILDRKGNGFEKHPLRLTGETKEIYTPYSIERAERLLTDIRKVTEEISSCYKTYLKIFGKSN